MKQLNFFIVIVLLLAACGKKLVDDVRPPALVVPGDFYKNEGQIRQAVNGLYATLRGRYNDYWLFTELPSDNTTTLPESVINGQDFDNLTLQPNSGISFQWNGHYQTIANANVLLNRITAVEMNPALKAQFTGEAKFIRALMYFNLVRYFGGVQLITTELTSPEEVNTYSRAPVAEVYAQIEKDLTEAIPGLPVRYTGADAGRATSGAAKALLAKALMQQRKHSQAVPVLKDIVDNEAAAGYMLLSNYANVFSQDNNAEIVFSVQYLNDNQGSGSNFGPSFTPQQTQISIYPANIAKLGNNAGTVDLWNAFEPGDLRRPVAIDTVRFTSNPLTYQYFTRKFNDPGITANNNSNIDWPVIRYADVLLLQAEALNETGATGTALVPLNRVRARAGLPALAGLSQVQARDAIAKERRVELSFEGHRWYDLIRYGTAVQVMTDFKNRYGLTALQINENKLLWPIPQREILLNPNLTQNPGY